MQLTLMNNTSGARGRRLVMLSQQVMCVEVISSSLSLQELAFLLSCSAC